MFIWRRVSPLGRASPRGLAHLHVNITPPKCIETGLIIEAESLSMQVAIKVKLWYIMILEYYHAPK